MKIFLQVLAVLFLAFVLSCGKKQEEVKFEKTSSAKDTTSSITQEKKDTNKNRYEASGETAKNYSSSEAKDHVNENAAVTGYVADVVVREKVAYLNFDKKYPKNTFTGVVFSEKFSEVGPLDEYKNKNVEIKGKITLYRDKAQIIINSKNQIRILK
jgi:DNA/RNA endonuclease YhcR with UshA esterase domain